MAACVMPWARRSPLREDRAPSPRERRSASLMGPGRGSRGLIADHSRRAARTPVPIRQSHFLNAFPLAHRLEARNVSLERVRGPRGAEPELNRAQLALCGGDKCGGIEHKQFIPWLTPCGHR